MCQSKCFSRCPHVEGKSNIMKERLNKDELAMFTASNGWLEKFKQSGRLRKTRSNGKANDIPKMTIQSWIERLSEVTSD